LYERSNALLEKEKIKTQTFASLLAIFSSFGFTKLSTRFFLEARYHCISLKKPGYLLLLLLPKKTTVDHFSTMYKDVSKEKKRKGKKTRFL